MSLGTAPYSLPRQTGYAFPEQPKIGCRWENAHGQRDRALGDILRRLQGDMAELKTGQQYVRHRLSLIETRLASMEHHLADQRYHHDTSSRMA